jgi:hypothetical protein
MKPTQVDAIGCIIPDTRAQERKFCEVTPLSSGTWRLSRARMVFGPLLGASTTCLASSITYVGSDADLGSGWRTSTVPKDDIDGNNVLESDGWFLPTAWYWWREDITSKTTP